MRRNGGRLALVLMICALYAAAALLCAVLLGHVMDELFRLEVLRSEGSLVLLAGWIAPVLSAGAVSEMTCAGSVLIIMIGTNLMGITKFKVVDYLPAIVIAPVIHNLLPLFERIWDFVS